MEPVVNKFIWFVSTATVAVLAYFLKRFIESVDRLRDSFEDFRLHATAEFVTKAEHQSGLNTMNARIDEMRDNA